MRQRSCSPREFFFLRGSDRPRLFIASILHRFVLIAAFSLSVLFSPSRGTAQAGAANDGSTSTDATSAASTGAGSTVTGSAITDTIRTLDAPQPAPQASTSQSSAQAKQAQQSPADDNPAPQTKRILGIIPNFRAVSTDQKLPRETIREKFMDATHDSFDYSSVCIPAVLAAYSQASSSYPEFGTGAPAYFRYFWRSAVDQTDENYFVEFVVPVITREDTRYYTLGRGGFFKRTGYALSRSVITRTDAGGESFNLGEVVGSGASAGLSTLYYPAKERSLANTGTQWGLDVGIDALSFMGREFWPDINRKIFHGKE